MDEQTKLKWEKLQKSVLEKLGVDINDEFASAVADIKQQKPDITNEEADYRAYVVLSGKYRTELRSTAIQFNGIVFGVSGVYDRVQRVRDEAQDMFIANKEAAIAEGYAKPDGTLLDFRQTIRDAPNDDYGQPLPLHDNRQTIFGVCTPADKEDLQMFQMTLWDRHAGLVDVPMFIPVSFRANPRSTQPFKEILSLNAWSHQSFAALTDTPSGFPTMDDVVEKYLKPMQIAIPDLVDYHKDTSKPPWRFAVIFGHVDDVGDRIETTGNARIDLFNDEEQSLDDNPITIWMPETVDISHIGRGSDIFAWGRTSIREFNEEEQVMLNATGVYATYVVPPEEDNPISTKQNVL